MRPYKLVARSTKTRRGAPSWAELCRQTFVTLAPGASLLTVGLLLGAGGAVLIALPGKHERIPVPASSDSGFASWRGAF